MMFQNNHSSFSSRSSSSGLVVFLVILPLVILLGAILPLQAETQHRGPNLNLFQRSRLSKVMKENSERDLATNRAAVKETYAKIRNQSGNLSGLANYFGGLKDDRRAKPLQAMVLADDGQYEAALKLLEELVANGHPDPWVTSEVARVKQMMDLRKAWELLDGGDEEVVLSVDEKKGVDEVLEAEIRVGQQKMRDLSSNLIRKYGDLGPLIQYLKEGETDQKRGLFVAIASLMNADLGGGEMALDNVVEAGGVDGWLYAELAKVKEMSGDAEAAIGYFEKALEGNPDDESRLNLSVRLAQLLYDLEYEKDAAKVLESVAGEGTKLSVEDRNFCARIAGLHGDDKLVVKWFQPTGSGKKRHLNLLFLGESFLRLGQFEQAKKIFEEAFGLAKLPRDKRYVLDRIVVTARKMNQLNQLVDHWLSSDELSPEHLGIMISVMGGELGRVKELLSFVERKDLPAKTLKLIQTPKIQERLVVLGSGQDGGWDPYEYYQGLMKRYPKDSTYRDGYVRLLLMDGRQGEAIAIYRKVIQTSDDSGVLMEVAAGARGLGLMDVAREAVDKVGGDAPVSSAIFKAALYREQGEIDRALKTLKDVEGKVEKDNGEAMMSLSSEYERLKDIESAIRLCRRAHEVTESERVLRKLIALLESLGKDEEAFELWHRLWETAGDPMTIMQANERVLELGARNGTLADLVIELEDRLVEDGLREREQSLLLDIYTSVGDPVSAADVLLEISKGKKEGKEAIEMQEKMLKVYMESELFGRCKRVLQKLIEIDSEENRDEHLQLLAVIALERKNNGDAMEVLEQLARRSEDGILRDSFSASVLSMLGKHEDAAKAFRRGLVVDPNDVESWLLWGNALAAKDTEERERLRQRRQPVPDPKQQEGNRKARSLFAYMLEDSQATDLFVICVDGLLNARAPRHSMLNALRRLNERIARNPHSLLLYRLSADLNEDMKRPVQGVEVLETALAVAGDSRPFIMRELIAMSRSLGKWEEEIRFGRSLLNVTEHLPPGECLELGNMLLERGFSPEAEVAFQRVLSDVNAAGAARDVASIYENSGLFEKAGKVIRSLIVENPFDVQLRLRLGLVEEKRGRYDQASKTYFEAIEMLTSRLPRKAMPIVGGGNQKRKLSVTEMDQFYDLTVRSLIGSTRTAEAREQMVKNLEKMVRDELKGVEENGAKAKVVSENRRLMVMVDLLRRVGFVFHRPGVVNAVDHDLIKFYGGDRRVVQKAADMRLKWQTKVAAGNFLAKHGVRDGMVPLVGAFGQGKDKAAEKIRRKSLPIQEKAVAGILSGMLGHDDLMDEVLKGQNVNQIPQEYGELLVTAGLAAGRPELVKDIILTNLNRLRRELEPLAGFDRSRQYLRPAKLYRQLVAAWPILSPQDRATAINLFGMMIGREGSGGLMENSYYHLLALNGGIEGLQEEDLKKFITGYTWNQNFWQVSNILSAWLESVPEDERVGEIQKILKDTKEKERKRGLGNLVKFLSPHLLTEDLKKEFPELDQELDGLNGFEDQEIDYVEKRQEYERAIRNSLRSMRGDVRKLFVLHDTQLRPAANLLPKAELDLLLEGFVGSEDPFERIVGFLLLKHAGRDLEAFEVMQNIAAMPVGNEKTDAALSAFPHFLNAYGWRIPAQRLMDRESTKRVLELERDFQRYDPLAILSDRSGNLVEVGARRVHAARMLKTEEQFKEAARIYAADTRHPDVFLNRRAQIRTLMLPDRMVEKKDGLLGVTGVEGPSILSDIVKVEGGQEWLVDLVRTISPSWATNEKEYCRQVALDAHRRGLSDEVKSMMEKAAERSALSIYDLELIEALARVSPDLIPDGFADQLEEFVLQNWRGSSKYPTRLEGARVRMGLIDDPTGKVATFAKIAQAKGRVDLAKALGRWAISMELLDTASPKGLKDYLSCFEGEERKKVLNDLVPFLGYQGPRVYTGEGLETLLEVYFAEGLNDAAEKQVDAYLKRRKGTRKSSFGGSNEGAMLGGANASQNAMDEIVARALVRLGRKEDYQQLLWKRCAESRYRRSTMNLSMGIGERNFVDLTGALPHPDDVSDIGEYLAIHELIIRRLRGKGSLDRESEVGMLCLLGKWCLDHGLRGEAERYLKQTEELSQGMFIGRLWVEDLRRFLGDEKGAVVFEVELLERDLLPMWRLEGVLDWLRKERGDLVTDATCYRISKFTNHPKVLEGAIKYAEAEELKRDFVDLVDRFRQVNTLFLSDDAACPFEGFETIGEWVAATSRVATRLPDEPKPKSLKELVNENHPAIARAFVQGDEPEMIYVPIIHDVEFSHLSATGTEDIRRVMENCRRISDRLYGRYGVRNIQLEGVSKTFVDRYNRIPVERRNLVGGGGGMIVHQTWSKVLGEKSWKLIPASTRALVGPLTAMGRQYEEKVVEALNAAKSNGWLRNAEVFEANEAELTAQLTVIAEEYNEKYRKLLEGDPLLKREYAITVTQRNKMFLDFLLAEDNPGVVFFGAEHWQDLEAQLKKRGTSYAVVVPKGVSWPRKVKTDQLRFQDMKELGAQLRDCNITLGDGGQRVIQIPFE